MTTGFQFYEGTTTESATAPRVTIRKGGVLVLTGATVDMLGYDVSHVQLTFNQHEDPAIAIRPADEGALVPDSMRHEGLTSKSVFILR